MTININYQVESDKISFMSKVPLFSSLAEKELLSLAKGLKPVRVRRGKLVCKEGDPGDSLFIIYSGIITVSIKENGEEKVLTRLYRGDFFGELSLLTGDPRSATARAFLDVELFLLSKTDFEQIIKANPLVSIHLSRILSHRLKQTSTSVPNDLSPCFYSVIGSQNSVGATTLIKDITANLSLELKKKVMVVDFDGKGMSRASNLSKAQTPDMQFLDDFNSFYNDIFLNCWFVNPSGVTIFLFPTTKDSKLPALINMRLSFILGILRKRFDYVFFDLEPTINPISKRALRLSDGILYLLANTQEGIYTAKKNLVKIKKISGDIPSAIRVGMSHLIGTTGIHRLRIKELLELPEAPEVWVFRRGKENKNIKAAIPKKKQSARKIAREIGGVRIGLALGGGGARGWAHIGVLEALEKEGIPIDMISGTSIGALVGAVYAKTVSAEKTRHLTIDRFPDKRSVRKNIFDYTVPSKGFIKGNKILQMLQDSLEGADFLDLEIPLSVIATDTAYGKEIVLEKGNVPDSVRASIAIPGIIEPVCIEKRWLVDGGLVNPVPASVLIRKGMNFIIGVFLERKGARPKWNIEKGPNIFNILSKSCSIVSSNAARGISELVNVAIYPQVNDYYWDDFHHGEELVKIGREAAYEAMDRIRKLLP